MSVTTVDFARGVRTDGQGPILNALPKPVVLVDAEDRISVVNLAAEQFFQTSANGLIGLTLAILTRDLIGFTELVINRGLGGVQVGLIALYQALDFDAPRLSEAPR